MKSTCSSEKMLVMMSQRALVPHQVGPVLFAVDIQQNISPKQGAKTALILQEAVNRGLNRGRFFTIESCALRNLRDGLSESEADGFLFAISFHSDT